MQFLLEAPLSAHTPQALITGRYPLQSGLSTSDSNLNPDLSPIYRIEVKLESHAAR